jgi:broad specificity phosphatase PhoE
MRCYLVRHAQTTWNHENRLQGHADQPLNALGLQQARHVGAYFSATHTNGSSLTALYSSPLQRSRQTAEAIARQTGLSMQIDPELAEMLLGDWEGLTPEEIDAQFDGGYARWRVTPSRVQIPGAEPAAQFHARVTRVFARIAQRHRGEDIVIVSHGGVIASLLAQWLYADYDRLLRRMSLENAGISRIDCCTEPPLVLWVNATHHLVR